MMHSTARTIWTPILDGREASVAWEVIESIARALENPGEFGSSEYTLLDGRPGPAMFLAYLAMATGDEPPRQRSLGLVEQAVDGLAEAATDVSLMTGFTGVAWTVEHLQGRAWEPADEDLNQDIDEAILKAFQKVPAEEGWPMGHDVMFGLTGLGVYALERLPRASAAEILRQVIERLDQMAERSEEGLAWLTPSRSLDKENREKYPNGFYSLGVAHGVPGIIGFLGMVFAARIEQPKVHGMIEEAVRWLLARRIPNASGSSFSNLHPRLDSPPSRSGWCYGNPAIATCLMIAARALSDKNLEETAHGFALESALRAHDDVGIVDAGLCHGAAGLGHLLNRVYQATGDERLREGARFWINHAIGMRRPGQGLAGFLALRTDGADMEPVYKSDPGFLLGVGGIGLALLAAVSTVEPDWDRVLLATLPPVAA